MGEVGVVTLTKKTEEGEEQQNVYNAEFIDNVNTILLSRMGVLEKALTEVNVGEVSECDCAPLIEIDGDDVRIQMTRKDSSDDENFVPRIGEIVYIEDLINFTIGDGVTTLSKLPLMFSTFSLSYTPENVSNKGQANGYVPLDANLKVPVMYLPSILTSVYEKNEIDALLVALSNTLTQLVNTEAQSRQNADTDIRDDLDDHTADEIIHVSSDDRDRWDSKLETSDLTAYENHINNPTPHITTAERNKWNNQTTAYICQTISERNAINTATLNFGDIAYVKSSAVNVTPVTYDKYNWFGTDGWNKDSQAAALLEIAWNDIVNRPNAVAATIDNTVAVAHVHNNRAIIDKFTQSTSGRLVWNGTPITSPITFYSTNLDLPQIGVEEHIYIVYRDSRCNNFPSISVWNEGGYELLGKGTNDSPPVMGDMVVLQRELYGVQPNTVIPLTITENSQFITLPIEVLKMIEGDKNVVKQYSNFTNPDQFIYQDYLLTFDNGLKVDSSPREAEMVRVDELYIHEINIDPTEYTNVTGVY